MKYGLPYQGSKNKLADRIVALLPKAANFYDLFAGGCAVSHAALLSGKFGTVHVNDITDSVILFEDAIKKSPICLSFFVFLFYLCRKGRSYVYY